MTPNRRRPRALRIVSEADPDFDSLYGLREDSESNNSQYKQTLHHGRARTVGANNLRLDRLRLPVRNHHHRASSAPLPRQFQFEGLVRGLSATVPRRPHRLSRIPATRTSTSRGRFTAKQSRTRPRARIDPL